MGFGKFMYWVLWLPVFTVCAISYIVFKFSSFIYFLKELAKGLHEEIKEF